jgi:two-component system response regulator FlrC
LLSEGSEIDEASVELGPQMALTGPGASGGLRPEGHPAGIAGLVGRRMDDVERDLIIETLGHTFGNRTHAATILGISIRALRNKLRDYAAKGVAVPPPVAGIAA